MGYLETEPYYTFFDHFISPYYFHYDDKTTLTIFILGSFWSYSVLTRPFDQYYSNMGEYISTSYHSQSKSFPFYNLPFAFFFFNFFQQKNCFLFKLWLQIYQLDFPPRFIYINGCHMKQLSWTFPLLFQQSTIWPIFFVTSSFIFVRFAYIIVMDILSIFNNDYIHVNLILIVTLMSFKIYSFCLFCIHVVNGVIVDN